MAWYINSFLTSFDKNVKAFFFPTSELFTLKPTDRVCSAIDICFSNLV